MRTNACTSLHSDSLSQRKSKMSRMSSDVYLSRHTSPRRKISNDETTGASSLHVRRVYERTSGNRCVPQIGGVDPVTRNCKEVLRGPSCGNSSNSRVISLSFFHSSHPTTEIITYRVPGFRKVRERPAITAAVKRFLCQRHVAPSVVHISVW